VRQLRHQSDREQQCPMAQTHAPHETGRRPVIEFFASNALGI
jgi:hypothetical protein